MKLLNIDEIAEVNEMFIMSNTNAAEKEEYDKYTYAEWLTIYTQVINVAGVDSFCESNSYNELHESFKQVASAVNHILFKHVINIKAAKKIIKVKYEGYTEAAENYVDKSLDASMIRDEDTRDKTRIALLLSYEKQIENIDRVTEKTLANLKAETPSIQSYENRAKFWYQYSLFNLGVNSGVSVERMKSHDSRLNQIKKNIDKMSNDISAGEELVKSKSSEYLYFGEEEGEKYQDAARDRKLASDRDKAEKRTKGPDKMLDKAEAISKKARVIAAKASVLQVRGNKSGNPKVLAKATVLQDQADELQAEADLLVAKSDELRAKILRK